MTPADRIAKQELDALKALVERLGTSHEVGQPGERLPPLVEQVYLRIAQLEAAYRKLDDDMHDALMVVQREKLATEHERDAALKRYDDLRQKYEALVLEYSACEDKRGEAIKRAEEAERERDEVIASASTAAAQAIALHDTARQNYEHVEKELALRCEQRRRLIEDLDLSMSLNAKLVEALDDANVALGNLINPNGHEGVLLRKHPQPCRGLDFCVVHDAQERHDKVRMALTAALDAAGKGAGSNG